MAPHHLEGAVRGVAGSAVAQPAVVDSVMSVVYVSVTSQCSRPALAFRTSRTICRWPRLVSALSFRIF